MKILFITGVFENEATGAARFAKLIYDKGGEDYWIMSEDTNGGGRIIKIKCKPAFYQKKLWQYFRIFCYRKQLLDHQDKYDVFVFNNPILAYGFNTNKPRFVFVHDEKLMKVNKTFRFDYLRKLILSRIERRVLESGVHIIANSRHITNRIIETYKVRNEKISLLYQGIDLSNKQSLYTKELSKDKIHILFVKNDFLIGGLNELIEALVMLKKYRFKLTIVGTSALLGNRLKEASHIEYDIQGIISNESVVRQLYNHDIMCIPSRFEPLGVAVMEGLAVGIPTITTGEGGLPEVTNNGEFVWECEPNNPQSIATQIEACIANSELRKWKSRGGKEYVQEKFDFHIVVDRLEQIISEFRPTS